MSIVSRTLVTAVRSPSFWAGSGAAVVSITSAWVGVIGHSLATLWSLRNELRSQVHSAPQTAGRQPERWRSGYGGLARDLLLSPGFNMAVVVGVYFASAIEAFLRGRVVEPLAFLTFTVAQAAATYLRNGDYHGERTPTTKIERIWLSAWSRLPSRIQNVLKNPAPWFSLGNISLILSGMDYHTLMLKPAIMALTLTGTLATGAALARGFWPLVTGSEGDKPKGAASYVAGVGNLLLGAASLFAGSRAFGAATLLWGVANLLWGRLMDRQQRAQEA